MRNDRSIPPSTKALNSIIATIRMKVVGGGQGGCIPVLRPDRRLDNPDRVSPHHITIHDAARFILLVCPIPNRHTYPDFGGSLALAELEGKKERGRGKQGRREP